jgi:Phage major capsid protein E
MIAMDLQDQLNMLRRRQEVMAGQVLSTGKLVISGEKYATVSLDFGRSPANMPVAATLWSVAGALPLNDLENWALLVLQSTGVMLTDVLMTVDVWNAFQTNQQVKDHLVTWRSLGQPPSLSGTAPVTEGGIFMGTIYGFNIYVYSAWYVDPADGTEKPILPAGSCILTSPALEGVKAYGAIRDEEAGLQSMPYFVKSWIEPDPSVRFLMMQSAPLVVPYRPNASLSAKVL